MKQLLQTPKSGKVTVADVPPPVAGEGQVLVRVAASLISAGTERYVLDFASKNLLEKARARPDLVRQVLDKARRDGVLTTLDAVRNRLDAPASLGYSNAGTVIAVGENVTGLRPGDRVACGGGGYAVHAEVVAVPANLVVPIADSVDFESAAFTTLGAVAQHGIRLAEVAMGEVTAVIGLGLLGQVTAQLLAIAGCTVIGFDPSAERAALARQLGAPATASDAAEFATLVRRHSGDRGADAVFVTAHAEDNRPIELAGEVARDRGTVLMLGTVPMDIPRKPYFEKELKFRISRSYGPGRYDAEYEEKGKDYPAGYVRWTENRNMAAFAGYLGEGKLNLTSLTSHRFGVAEAAAAYDLITGKTVEAHLGVLLSYPQAAAIEPRVTLRPARPAAAKVRIGMIGAGNFARSVLLPAMKRAAIGDLVGVCTASSASAKHVGEKFGFAYCTCAQEEVLRDASINTVVIATPHHLHGAQVIAALRAGKHVFCEKPLCLSEPELEEIAREYSQASRQPGAPSLMVGYNRRFAPMVSEIQNFFAGCEEPLVMQYRVNAGYIAPDNWLQDPERGGGRIVGELCHFADLLMHLAGAMPVRLYAVAAPNGERYRDDNLAVTIAFANGCVGTVTYVAAGDKSFSKERLEVFGGGRVACLDDFRSLELVARGRRRTLGSNLRQDKGHAAEWLAFATSITEGSASPIPFEQIVASSLMSFRTQESIRTASPINVDVPAFLSAALDAGGSRGAGG